MRLGNRLRLILSVLLICSSMSIPSPAPAQLRAGAAVAISATLPSSVTLSESVLPVMIEVSNGVQTVSSSNLNIKWNLDARTATGFRIIGAMVTSTLPATSLEVRTALAAFRPLRQNGSIVLLDQLITAATRPGELQTQIQLQINSLALKGLPDGAYQGWLNLEAQIL